MSQETVVSYVLLKCCDYLEPEVVQWLQNYNGYDKAKTLEDKLEWIDAYLKDAHNKWEGNEREKLWMTKIADVAGKGREAINNFVNAVTNIPKWKRSFPPFGNPLRDAVGEIDRVLEALAETIANKSDFGIESFR